MKRRTKSKSKSKGKDWIKIKTLQNTDKNDAKTQNAQIKPVSINQIKDPNIKSKSNPQVTEIKNPKLQKIEELFKGPDNPPKYSFNLHKHLKENLKFKGKTMQRYFIKRFFILFRL